MLVVRDFRSKRISNLAIGEIGNAHGGNIGVAAAETTGPGVGQEDLFIKVVSFNIWNLNHPWNKRMLMLEDQVTREDPDIIGWQEVRYDWSKYQRSVPHRVMNPEQFKVETLKGWSSPFGFGVAHLYVDLGNTGRLQVEQLAHLQGFENYQFVFVPAMTYLNLNSRTEFHSDEGLAIFSKYPILNSTVRILSRNAHDGGNTILHYTYM